jgi:type I restriction enzyme S subunit
MSRGPVGETSKVNPESAQDGPYELPEGWVWTPLGDVCAINPRHERNALPDEALVSFVPMAAVDQNSGSIPRSSVRPYGEIRKGFTHFEEADVLFARITPCMENGKIAVARNLVNGLGCGTTEFHVLRPSGRILPEYIYRYLRQESFRRAAAANMSGTAGQLRVPTDYIRSVRLPLAPLAEQRRIVARIEALFEQSRTARQALDRIPPLLKKFRQSVLAAAFRGDLTRDWRENHPDIEPTSVLLDRIRAERRRKWEEGLLAKGKDPCKARHKKPDSVDPSGLEDLPDGWEYTTISEIGCLDGDSVLTGPFGAQLPSREFVPEGVPVIAIGNVMWGNLNLEKLNHVIQEKALKLRRYTLQSGDVLFTRSGTVGRSALVPEYARGWLMSYHLLRVRVEKSVCDPMYLYFVFRGLLTIQDQITDTARGATRPGFNTLLLKRLRLPLPPMDEQRWIVAKVEEFFAWTDVIEAAVVAARRRAKALEQSILARAFRGELVPQDPDDEPASTVLDRIWDIGESGKFRDRSG